MSGWGPDDPGCGSSALPCGMFESVLESLEQYVSVAIYHMQVFGHLRFHFRPMDSYVPQGPHPLSCYRPPGSHGRPFHNTNNPDVEPSAEENATAFIARIEGTEYWPGKFALRELVDEYEDACERLWGRVVAWNVPWEDNSEEKIRTLLGEVDQNDRWLVAVLSMLCRYRVQRELFDEARRHHAKGPQPQTSVTSEVASGDGPDVADLDDQQH